MISKTTARTRYGAVGVVLAAAVMFVALVAHPYLERLPDAPGVAAAIEGRTVQWGIVHLLTAVGSGLVALAFLAIRAYLRDAGEDRFSVCALPLVVLGSTLYGLLPGLEFAALAAAETGADVAAAQDALQPWFISILATSAIIFAAGMVGFAWAIVAGEVLGRPLTRVVVTGLLVLGMSRLVPLGAVQLYLQAAALVVALCPLAYQMWQPPRTTPTRTSRSLLEQDTSSPAHRAADVEDPSPRRRAAQVRR